MSEHNIEVKQFVIADYDERQAARMLYSPPFPILLSEGRSGDEQFDTVEIVRECDGRFILDLTLFDSNRGSILRMGEELLSFSAAAPRPTHLVSIDMSEVGSAILWRKNFCFGVSWAWHRGEPLQLFRTHSA